MTTLLVTHDQEEALSLADRVAVMWDGRIIQDAPPEELYYRPVNKHVAKFVGESHFLPGEMEGRRVACELGTLPAYGQSTGSVEVMVRPEMLRMSPAGDGNLDNASVLTRLFFGHDQLMRIQLDSGALRNGSAGHLWRTSSGRPGSCVG